MNFICKICGNTSKNEEYKVREMMFGFRDEFIYTMCLECGCLQLKDIPDNMNKYYPSNYYSFDNLRIKAYGRTNLILNKIRTRIFFNGFNMFKSKHMPNWIDSKWKHKYGFNLNSKILDVGSGSGLLLLRMYNLGFTDLTGIDPNINNNTLHFNKIKILKREISDINETFDFIMLNHSFEHLYNPLESLQKIYSITRSKGLVMIRIPLVSSYSWRKYKTNWVQLDAPRHIFLHSIKSMGLLIQEAGFLLKELSYDSTSFQFVGSEQYLRDISLMNDNNSISNGLNNSIFTYEDVKKYNVLAKKLNAEKDGDQACFLLYKE